MSRCIDVHAHYLPETVLSLVAARGEEFGAVSYSGPEGPGFTINGSLKTGPTPPEDLDLDLRIQSMDRQGVSIQVLSMTTPMFYWAGEDLAALLCVAYNDAANDVHRRQPGRILAFAQLPMNYPDRAIEELERIRKLPGIRGVYMGTHVGPLELSDRKLFPIYERIADLGWPIFLHPIAVIGYERLSRDFYLNNLLGNPVEAAIAAAHLIFGGVLDAFPRLHIGLPHGGGALPILIGRFNHGYEVRPECRAAKKRPEDYLNRFSFDTLGHSDAVLRHLLNLVGPQHVVLGSDYCADMGYADPVGVVERIAEISDHERQAILWENAAKLLNVG